MCGIFAVISDNLDDLNLNKFSNSLNIIKYRGPDKTNIKKISKNIIFGHNRLKIIDHIPQNLLASAYAAAAVHALPSWMETCGLVSLEAALSGTPLVGSTFGHELEYLEGDAWYADPGNAISLRNAVLAALGAGRQHSRPIAMKRKVLERFNWEQTVDATERLYRRVLKRRH